MKHYMRVCAEINLDAVAYNFRNMKENLNPETQMIAVVKTDGYGHGAVPIAYQYSNKYTPKGSAMCVQRFDDSQSSAIRITYRISLRSSSFQEPRYPS